MEKTIHIHRTSHSAGEYVHTAADLTLSVGFNTCHLEMSSDGKHWSGVSRPGDLKIMPAGHKRIFRHRSHCEFAAVSVSHTMLPLSSTVAPRVLLRDAPLRHTLDALFAEATAGPPSALFQDAIAQAIVGRLLALDSRLVGETRYLLPPRCLSRVLDYLDAHLDKDVSVTQLAEIAGISPSHFSTLFRNSTGVPPHRYHTRMRVERARLLLERGSNPTEAAIAVGFYDQSHLARHLRRVLGVSPTAIRHGS